MPADAPPILATSGGGGVPGCGTDLVDGGAERDGAAAYSVVAENGRAVKTRLETRRR
jgi:hypothetical protein